MSPYANSRIIIFIQLREYDKELGDFDGRLFEFPINFVPSYPFQEDVNEPANYMQTRVPAWCDRVLLSPSAKALVQDVRILIKFTYARSILSASLKAAHTNLKSSCSCSSVQIDDSEAMEYSIIGQTTCMGDHKVKRMPFNYCLL